jgi:hypothetical protein
MHATTLQHPKFLGPPQQRTVLLFEVDGTAAVPFVQGDGDSAWRLCLWAASRVISAAFTLLIQICKAVACATPPAFYALGGVSRVGATHFVPFWVNTELLCQLSRKKRCLPKASVFIIACFTFTVQTLCFNIYFVENREFEINL